MIRYTTGNLLDADVDVLVNTVNCVGVMGKGIALQFRKAWPENYEEYRVACERKEVRPGRMFVHETGRLVKPRLIINFPTKRHWKEKSRIEDVASGLDALASEIRERGIESIALPPLGCGNGGLDWGIVRNLIEDKLRCLGDVEVLIYENSFSGSIVASFMTKEVTTNDEIRCLELGVLKNARNAAEQLMRTAEQGIHLLRRLKFERAGFHPLSGDPLNLLEQVNQTFTFLVTFEAARIVLAKHRDECSGLRLHLGTAPGSDIESVPPGVIAAEVFAAVSPDNNDKLTKDISKVGKTCARYKYVFFHSPGVVGGRQRHLEPQGSSVEVWSVLTVGE
jgi:O-acetyl-ADP-ribose deacetylase (regulator of RNase III)